MPRGIITAERSLGGVGWELVPGMVVAEVLDAGEDAGAVKVWVRFGGAGEMSGVGYRETACGLIGLTVEKGCSTAEGTECE